MTPRCDGYFLSGRQRSEDWHAGVCMVKEFFDYLKLFEDRFWLSKTHPTPDLDFPGYLADIGIGQALRLGIADRDPRDEEHDFVHQTGRYALAGDQLELIHRVMFRRLQITEILQLPLPVLEERIEQELRAGQAREFRWTFRIVSPERLVSPSGATYVFHPAGAP